MSINTINKYKQNNCQYFNELNDLITKYPKHYSQMLLSTKRYLYNWIISSLPQLDDSFTISTKCYWILNNFIDFPKCKNCGKVLIQKYIKIHKGHNKFCSNYCVTHSKERRHKIQETCLARYGVKHTSQLEYVKEKIKNTCIERYNGIPFSKQSTIYPHLFDKLSKQENKKIINPSQVKLIANKIKQTKINRYGTAGFNMEKLKQTNIKKYGVPFYFCSKQFKQFYLSLFGVNTVFKLKHIQDKCRYRYTYNNINFDSAPEIAFYIWLTDNNIQFEYQPNIKIEYEYNNKKMFYMPDFKVENKLYEIKGDQFLKPDGTWQCPYNHLADDVYEAKHQCLIKNNVNILYKEDYKKYLNYVTQQYGKTFLNSFKNNLK